MPSSICSGRKSWRSSKHSEAMGARKAIRRAPKTSTTSMSRPARWASGLRRRCPLSLYSALVFQGGAAWRKRLLDDIGDQGNVMRLIESRSDEELSRLMNNLAGHDLPSLIEAFEAVDHDRPVCFICYTIKGVGLPFAGHKDNHAGLMTPAQIEKFRGAMDVRPGHE